MTMNRRRFIQASLLALAVTGLPGGWSRATRLRVREFHFLAQEAEINLGQGPTFKALTYNSLVPGPEIRATEGEIIQVTLENRLKEPTTIHWHGLPVPNAMDGAPGVTQEPVAPGQSMVYRFPAYPAGTFFYHSHFGPQLDQGLYGPLIIEPARSSAAYDQEYTLLLEDWATNDWGGPAAQRRRPLRGMMGRGMMGRGIDPGLLEPWYNAYAVNGGVFPALVELKAKKGDKVRLRLINAASANIFNLRLAGHRLNVIATDGNPVLPRKTDVLRIAMGERYDVEFIADNPGRWLLMAHDSGYGENQLRVPLRYKGVGPGNYTPPRFTRDLELAGPWGLEAEIPDALPAGLHRRAFAQTLSGGMHSPYWTINGRRWPGSDVMTVRQGEKVRLAYGNHSHMPHPMHLHGHFFKVVNPALPPESWITKDTLVVDPMRRAAVEFIADNSGRWLHHCHHAYHMGAGMMNLLEVTGNQKNGVERV